MERIFLQNRGRVKEKWTQSAIDCYEIGSRCEACFLFHVYFKNAPYKCYMKEVVKKLIRKVGIPVKNEKKICEEEKGIFKGYKELR